MALIWFYCCQNEMLMSVFYLSMKLDAPHIAVALAILIDLYVPIRYISLRRGMPASVLNIHKCQN